MEEFMKIPRKTLAAFDRAGRAAEGAVVIGMMADRLEKERELERMRKTRPRFGKGSWEALSKTRHALDMLEEGVMRGETGIAAARNALILIACAIRFLNREWKNDD